MMMAMMTRELRLAIAGVDDCIIVVDILTCTPCL